MSLPLDDTEANAELPPAIWVFGYGSLVWRPSFPFTHRVEGYIRGYRRRFWQGSTDHRGVPGAPGRVVTCVPPRRDLGEAHSDSDESWRVYGVAYRTEDVAHVLEYLDVREQGGYTRTWVPVYASDQHPPSSPIVERVCEPCAHTHTHTPMALTHTRCRRYCTLTPTRTPNGSVMLRSTPWRIRSPTRTAPAVRTGTTSRRLVRRSL